MKCTNLAVAWIDFVLQGRHMLMTVRWLSTAYNVQRLIAVVDSGVAIMIQLGTRRASLFTKKSSPRVPFVWRFDHNVEESTQ